MKVKAREVAETIPDRQRLNVSSKKLLHQGLNRLYFSESKGTGRHQIKLVGVFVCFLDYEACMHPQPIHCIQYPVTFYCL